MSGVEGIDYPYDKSRRQPPIHFGGVQLSEIPDGRAVKHEFVGEPGWNPPAGEATPEARLVAVSRAALAVRIKHGVPLADLLGHMQTLALVEANLISYQDTDRFSRFPLADG